MVLIRKRFSRCFASFLCSALNYILAGCVTNRLIDSAAVGEQLNVNVSLENFGNEKWSAF